MCRLPFPLSDVVLWNVCLYFILLLFWNVMETIVLHHGAQIDLKFELLLQRDCTLYFIIEMLLFISKLATQILWNFPLISITMIVARKIILTWEWINEPIVISSVLALLNHNVHTLYFSWWLSFCFNLCWCSMAALCCCCLLEEFCSCCCYWKGLIPTFQTLEQIQVPLFPAVNS